MRQKINVHVRKAEREAPEYYAEFVQKFEAKHTTDDCMTPEPVYQAVLDWARADTTSARRRGLCGRSGRGQIIAPRTTAAIAW